MVGYLNPNRKTNQHPAILILCVLITFASYGQLFKRKNKPQDDKRSAYAYQTYSTTQRKEKKRGYAGRDPKFHFEKPMNPVQYGKIDRAVDYSKAPYFGHKRPPIKRPPGSQKLCRVCGIKH